MDCKEDKCFLLDTYGDGVKFTEPVWYSCGHCKICKRLHQNLDINNTKTPQQQMDINQKRR